MSKKKGNGSTMTLRDFHGGSIPSDLPLPSAPGVIVRPSDRPGYDRPVAWGNQLGRPESRPRPHTSPATRHFDDKAPFLTHTAHIGRNFDEDERKPLDGGSAPRRTISDESIRGPSPRTEPKQESATAAGGSWGQQGLSSVAHVQHRRVNESTNVGHVVGGASQNAWAVRKEAAVVSESPWSAPNAVSKLAHASALNKVSSGRWQSKSTADYPAEAESGSHVKAYGNNSYENKNVVEDYERTRTSVNTEAKERTFGKFGAGEQNHSEPSERPKLNLLPRTKPLESLEQPPVADHFQAVEVRVEHESEGHGNLKPGFAATAESEKQAVERPKLNLKPRSQPAEQRPGSVEGGRNVLFGGARPRELVLKERGVDDVAVNHDLLQLPERVEQVPKAKKISGLVSPFLDPRAGNKSERREHEVRMENIVVKKPEKADPQLRSWRGNEGRKSREVIKQQPPPERAASPETWRKPVEEPKPSSAEGPRFGKAASAVELAASFSKSSLADPIDRPASQRNLANRPPSQIPFSRLTGPSPRPQINGY